VSSVTITASKLNVRQGPDQGAAVLTQLPLDTQVEKLAASADGQWFQIRTAAGTSGWIAAKYAVESPAVAAYVSVNASMLNLRQAPAPTASVVRKLPQGTVLQKLADSSDGQWVQVRTTNGSDTGWVSATYVLPASAPAASTATPVATTVSQPAAPAPAPVAQPAAGSGAMAGKSLAYRCLALTAGFETEAMPPECFAGLAGDFDGQAMSFGVLQWNLGQGTLQPLLRQMDQENPSVVQEVMGDGYAEFKSFLGMGKDAQMAWARGKQANKKWQDPWRSRFKALGRTAAMQQIQVNGANARYTTGMTLVQQYGLWSERGAALMFDIVVQNGSIKDATRQQMMADFAKIDSSLSREDQEVARMRIIANRRAEAANSKFVEDVRSRKLTIANGSGKVHGAQFNLEATYGIRLVPIS
jgi:SH3-like domain-containing protein